MIHALIVACSVALEFSDDVASPAAYRAALLEQTNVLLTALETEGAEQRSIAFRG